VSAALRLSFSSAGEMNSSGHRFSRPASEAWAVRLMFKG
jgi:hypothetical protein